MTILINTLYSFYAIKLFFPVSMISVKIIAHLFRLNLYIIIFIYNLICRTIMKLPHQSSIRHWTSTIDVKPGFLSQVLEQLDKVPE